MQSLRTRRPSESRNQKPSKPPQKLAKPARNTSARKSRVDDKIKKRFSMRYGDISSPTNASVPAVPALPIGVRPTVNDEEEVVKESQVSAEDAKVAELQILDKEDFDPDSFLKAKLANSTEIEIKSMETTLQESKAQTADDLRKNVFKNYSQFMSISKEINTLENDMLELKASLSEWKNIPSLLHIEESTSSVERRRTQRASIADLRALYADQMQTLHTQIEGSSTLVPTIPGRHLITEMEGISTLNPATYKVEHNVKFVLFDDTVLVAKYKNRRTGERPKLVADRCWPLNDILILDTKDTATITNVFKIRQGKDTHVFRTEIASDKKAILTQFRQVAEELAAKKRKEREGDLERRKSMRYGPGTDYQKAALELDFTSSMPDWMKEVTGENGIPSAKEKAEKDALWVGDFTDKLIVAIALHQWENAVDLVAEGELKISIIPTLGPKLTSLTNTLSTALLEALAEPTNRKSTVVRLTGLLQRLRKGAAARKTFLTMRSKLIQEHVRMIQFLGLAPLYISDLAIVTFTSIKHTADWFLNSFKDNDSTSYFVTWAKEEIEKYAHTFRLQVFSEDVEQEHVEECIRITQNQSRKLLQEFGLDFRYLFEELLVPKPQKIVPPRFHSHKSSLSVSSVDTVLSSVLASTNINGRNTPTPTGDRPPRPKRSSPLPQAPPRSSNRPGSSVGSVGRRPAPIAVPTREGML